MNSTQYGPIEVVESESSEMLVPSSKLSDEVLISESRSSLNIILYLALAITLALGLVVGYKKVKKSKKA